VPTEATPPDANAATEPAAPKAQSAGRGLLFITAAKVWFMVGGAAIGFLLPRMFPRSTSVQRYGEWGLVLSAMSVLNNVLVTGTIQSVSKFASRGARWIEGAKRVALGVNLVGGALVALLYLLVASPLVAWFERNPSLLAPLRLSTGVVFCYAIYAVFVGAANGAREFHKQAGLDIGFTTLRATLVLGAALAFSTVFGAVGGFVLAAAAILAASIVVVGVRPVQDKPSAREYLGFLAPVAVYLAILNVLMFVDLWLLARLVSLGAEHAGRAPGEAAAIANRAVGAYNAALQIARLPYQAILAVTFVLFPLVSQATFSDDAGRTRGYVAKAMRLSLLVVVAAAVAVAARPDALLAFLFPKNDRGVNEYLAGAAALGPLMFAYVGFSMFSIAGTIINGAGLTRAPIAIGLGTLALDAAANAIAIPWALARGSSPLLAAGVATTVAMLAGFVASLAYLERRFGASLAKRSAARIAIAAAAGVLVGRVLPLPSGARFVAHALGLSACVAGAAVYLALLFATGELSFAELRALTRRGAR